MPRKIRKQEKMELYNVIESILGSRHDYDYIDWQWKGEDFRRKSYQASLVPSVVKNNEIYVSVREDLGLADPHYLRSFIAYLIVNGKIVVSTNSRNYATSIKVPKESKKLNMWTGLMLYTHIASLGLITELSSAALTVNTFLEDNDLEL